MRLKSGSIENLTLQPKFELQPSYKRNNKTIRAINYVADFKYTQDGVEYIIDVKGFKTEIYKIKKKMLLFKYPDLNFIEA